MYTSKKLGGLALLLAVGIGSCSNGKPTQSEGTVMSETETVAALDSTAEARKISSAALERFAGWTIDSVAGVGERDSVAHFRIKGSGREKIAGHTMRVQTDSATRETCSYVILGEIAKNAAFEMDALYLPEAGVVIVYPPERGEAIAERADLILISKRDMRLRLINLTDSVLLNVSAATGRKAGNKQRYGDKKTPEGIFTIYDIHDASGWDYDFHDGKGRIKGTYGKYFIRFKEYYHIGIHGTHLPETVGSRSSESCIRLRNEDLERVVPQISRHKTLIIVTPAYEDVIVGG